MVRKIDGEKGEADEHNDLEIDGDTLIIPKCNQKVVQYYQLNMD